MNIFFILVAVTSGTLQILASENGQQYHIGALGSARARWFVSHIRGSDSSACGSVYSPCKTLSYTASLIGNGDSIYLDGRKTKENPYGCEKSTTASSQQRVTIEKSVAIIGYYQRAYLSCYDYVIFSNPSNIKVLNVSLQNVTFVGTGTHFQGDFDVTIFKSAFSNCSSFAIIANGPNIKFYLRSLVFTHNRNGVVIDVNGEKSSGPVGDVSLLVSDVIFNRNPIQFGVIVVQNWSGQTSVLISNSSFEENQSEPASPLVYVEAYNPDSGNMRMENCSFTSNSNGFAISGWLNMHFSNLHFTRTHNALFFWLHLYNNVGRIFITNTIISEADGLNLDFSDVKSSFITVQIKDTIIRKNINDRMQVDISDGDPRPSELFSTYHVLMDNVTFHSLSGSAALSIFLINGRETRITIENSIFLNNKGTSDMIVYMSLPSDGKPDCWNIPPFNSHVYFKNTKFQGNIGYVGGIVYIRNGQNTFINCLFEDNYLLNSTVGGVLYQGDGSGSLRIINGTFLKETNKRREDASQKDTAPLSFIYSEGTGPLIVNTSTFLADLTYDLYPIINSLKARETKLDSYTTIKCPVGSGIQLVNSSRYNRINTGSYICPYKITTFQVFCHHCPSETYNLKRGQSTGLTANNLKCFPCPYGATCFDKQIKARPNFWGYVSSKQSSTMNFVPCPEEYCRPQSSPESHKYKVCYGKRTGTMCGACINGYTEELFSTECRKNSRCHSHWFWFASAVYIMAFALFIIVKPPILSYTWRQTLWFKIKTNDCPPQQTHFGHGYLKIIFYFYQVSELLLITTTEGKVHEVPFLHSIVGLFNFQVRSFYGGIGCPFVGLTAVTKELFLCLKVFATIWCTAIIFGIHKGISKFGKMQRPSLNRYLAAALEILLLGYERLSETSLVLLHCVPIGLEWRVFLDGNIRCWQWWQYVLITYIIVHAAPFVMVLFFGSIKLYRKSVSVNEFLGACVLPLPFIIRWAAQRCRKSNQTETDHTDGEEISEILHESFRESTEETSGTVYWESVLIGRRFFLLCLHSFIADPLVRLTCLDCACVLILAHHIIKKPYRDVRANTCETISLLALVVIATFNLGEAALMSAGVNAVGPNEKLFHIFQWVDLVLLGIVPAAFGVLLVFAILSQLCRSVIMLIKGLVTLQKKICGEYSSDADEQSSLVNPVA